MFHHLLAQEGDPYLLVARWRLLIVLCWIVIWQQCNGWLTVTIFYAPPLSGKTLSAPVQVVWRQAALSVTELTLDPAEGPVSGQLAARFNIVIIVLT